MNQEMAQIKALELFHETARNVPAYKDFLAKNKINPKKIKTFEDFSFVPPVDKKNYLTQYPLHMLCRDGNLFSNQTISVSSGSTGSTFFWPRGEFQENEGADIHEQIYRDIFQTDTRSTLVVICFSMGTWIAGTFTNACTVEVSKRGYKINVITPGLEKDEILKTVKNLSPLYEQTILTGYPPFIKDVVDEGTLNGIKWRKLNVKFIWAGEAFSEEWRDYVLRLAGSRNPFFDSINIYGSADASILGHETPVSILLRRIYNRRRKTAETVFGTPILPSLVQYYPERRFFETIDSELVFTASAGIPLVRYNIHDTGGTMEYKDLIAPVEPQFQKELAKHHINKLHWQLPFIYLNGRKDFTVTIYAVNIYPENIKAALVDPKVRSWVTGRFTMATKYRSDMDQYFEINIEMAKGVEIEDDYIKLAKSTIIKKLIKLNGEYNKLHNAIGAKAEPTIHLVPQGDSRYFANGVKHRWVKKG
jgi:phenylacetate-CoA ligase